MDWLPEDGVSDGESLCEAAGRSCFQSWTRPNPATATNAGYIKHILEVGHNSVLEHASATFYITGVSRSFTHELVRHRHLSFSQLSQRYVDENDVEYIKPDVIAESPELSNWFERAMDSAAESYMMISDRLLGKFGNTIEGRKAARQAARAVLPNATETRIVVTGNYRAWRHFISMRASEHADVEIRKIAIMVLRQLQELSPNAFADFAIIQRGDTEIAICSNAERG